MTDRIVYVGPNYQVIPPKKKTRDFFGYVLPAGAVCTTAGIALYAINKNNRGDTFVSTAKKCVQNYASSNKKTGVDFLNVIGAKGLGKKLEKVSNKKFLPFMLGADIVINGLVCGWLHDLIHGNR